jgi:hypothetical protein
VPDTDRYYLVRVTTNAPEHQFPRQDQTMCRELRHAFGSNAKAWVLEDVAIVPHIEAKKPPIPYDHIIDDGHPPEGYVPVYEREEVTQ